MAQRTSAICQVPWGPGPWCSEWWPSRWARRLRGALVANSWEPRHVKVKTHYFRGSRNWFKGLFFSGTPKCGRRTHGFLFIFTQINPLFLCAQGPFLSVEGYNDNWLKILMLIVFKLWGHNICMRNCGVRYTERRYGFSSGLCQTYFK